MILLSWENTPYMKGQRKKRVGVDCVRFLCAVMDELYVMEPAPSVELPQDVALHAPHTARAAMRKIMSRYPDHRNLDQGESVEPGDVVITGPERGGPGHAMIVGADPGLWHATGLEVQRGGLIPTDPIHHVLRPQDKHRWLKHCSTPLSQQL